MNHPQVASLQLKTGQSMGASPWLELTQDRVTAFGGITLDFDPHHIDPQQARSGPFGLCTAQGFLTLSLLTHFIGSLPAETKYQEHINYGFNKVRFIRPAVVGHHLRAEFKLQDLKQRDDGFVLMTMAVVVESRETNAPVMAAEWLTLVRF